MGTFWQELAWRAPITVVTALISFAVYLLADQYWRRLLSRRLREAAERYAKQHQQRREVALVLSVLTDIRESALGHLDKTDCQGIQVFQVHQKEGFPDEEDAWVAYLEKIKAEVRTIREMGVQRIFLFANVSLALAVLAGAVLSNGPEVLVHHFAAGRYVPVGRLSVDTVRL